MKPTLRILIVEDSEDDAILVLHQINKEGYNIEHQRVETAEEMVIALNEKTWDIVLSDYQLPQFNGLEALAIFIKSGIDIPFIIISGLIGEEVAVEAMKNGAHDYIMKNNLSRLVPTIERELKESKNRAERKLLEQKKKQAEDALADSENRYRRIAEELTDYLYTVYIENGRTIKTVQSQSCLPVTGYTPEEFAADPYLWLNMVFPDDRELVKERIQQILTGIDIPPIEHRIIRKDGVVRWVCDTTIQFKDSSGQLHSYDGVIKDITLRKQADMEIIRMNRALRMLSDVNHALIHVSDEHTLLNKVCRIIVDEGGYRMVWVGYADNNDAKTLHSVAQASYKAGCIESQNLAWADAEKGPGGTVIRTGRPFIAENIHTDPNFTPWHAAATQCGFKSIIALPLTSNDIIFGSIVICSDGPNKIDPKEVEILNELSNDLAFGITTMRIKTEKDQAEEALKNSERKYRVVADNTFNWEFWTDVQGKFVYCSPSCLRVSGYTEFEFIDDADLKFKIVHPDYHDTFFKHAHRIPTDNLPISLQFKIIHKDGSERWIEHVCQPVFDANNSFIGFRGSNCDITEKKETDRLILNAIITTEETERNNFSQELHDGLGPTLSTVKLYFQWLSETSDPSKQKSITEKGLQNIDDAIQTVREISNNLSPRILNNLGLVPALKYLIQRINETRKLLIEFTFDEERRYSSQTEITLYRINSELLNNTIKYAKANTIQINIAHNYDKKFVLLTYSDNGKGFDLNKVIKDKKGLGLHNMMQRVSTLKGFINFDTEEGKSLKVRIELPLLDKEK